MPGPDFTTGGEVFAIKDLHNFYKTGEDTKMMVRGKTKIEGKFCNYYRAALYHRIEY